MAVRTMKAAATIWLVHLLTIAAPAWPQFQDVASDGSKGILDFQTPGAVVFDPARFPTKGGGLRTNNIFRFSGIRIGKGVTVTLSSKSIYGPVFWLSQGPVEIDGTVFLSGESGSRLPALAGAGGFPGAAVGEEAFRLDGYQPNRFLVPLVGGFGGKGGETNSGGAGGGALLISSSTSISINGAIIAKGGDSVDGIGGGGGSIRLVAPVIDGHGVLNAKGGQPGGTDGRIRLEATRRNYSGDLSGTPASYGKPHGLFLPPNPSASVQIVSIDGVPLSTLEFVTSGPKRVALVIEARFLPPGTPIELEVFAENGFKEIITTTPLEGSLETSRATARATLPGGRARVMVKAGWRR